MAIIWEVTIIPRSVGAKVADVIGVATNDEEDPLNPITVSVEKVPLDTQQEQVIALQVLYDRYLSRVSRSVEIDTWLSGKEDAAKTWLEVR